MSEKETAENKTAVADTATQTPAPVVEQKPEAAKAENPVNEQTEHNKKANLAFIKMRQERKALEKELNDARARLNALNSTPSPAATNNVSQSATHQVAEPVTPNIGVDIDRLAERIIGEVSRKQAAEVERQKTEQAQERVLTDLASDAEVSAIPGGVIEVLETIDSDPRLSQINRIDPALALREAKAIFKQKYGIGGSSAPVKHPHGSGSMPSKMDLSSIEAELDKATPGTKRYSELVTLLNEAHKKG